MNFAGFKNYSKNVASFNTMFEFAESFPGGFPSMKPVYCDVLPFWQKVITGH